MARESKAELTDRLRREGRWDEFKARREQLKTEGVPAKHAWFQAAVEFAPENESADDELVSRPDLAVLKNKPPVSVLEAAQWVFEHLDTDWIEPADAPSAGAWSLLQWARSSMTARSQFYKQFAQKLVMPAQETECKAESHESDLMERLFGNRSEGEFEATAERETDALISRLQGAPQ